jgi:hypothetical protein
LLGSQAHGNAHKTLPQTTTDQPDHRIQTGDPPGLADGYLETLTSFALQASA